MKQRLKTFARNLFHLPLGYAVIIAICLFFAYSIAREIYYKLAYRLPDTVLDILRTVGFIAALAAFLGIANYVIDKRDKRYKDKPFN